MNLWFCAVTFADNLCSLSAIHLSRCTFSQQQQKREYVTNLELKSSGSSLGPLGPVYHVRLHWRRSGWKPMYPGYRLCSAPATCPLVRYGICLSRHGTESWIQGGGCCDPRRSHRPYSWLDRTSI